jgi:D-xylose transport system substrate-binding protein
MPGEFKTGQPVRLSIGVTGAIRLKSFQGGKMIGKVFRNSIMVLCLFAIMAGSAFAAAPVSKKTGKALVVGISMPTLQEERWQKDRAIVVNQLLALGVSKDKILQQSADGDEQKQVTQCENLITQGIDVLIIFPQNGEACAPVVTSAHEAGVKVVAIDRIIKNVDLDFFITYDAYTIGVIQGTYITNVVNAGNWIMIAGAPQDPNAALIRQGQMSKVQPLIDKGAVKVVLDQAANYWNPDEALKYTEQGLTANNNNIQCVFTSNDGCAGAAIEALKEQGLAGKVPVPGLDADVAACQRIVAGTQNMTVYRKLSIMDMAAAKVAVAMGTGVDIGKAVGIAIVTKNNGKLDVPAILFKGKDQMFAVDNKNMEEVVKDGWLKAADIYRDVAKDKWPNWTKKYN